MRIAFALLLVVSLVSPLHAEEPMAAAAKDHLEAGLAAYREKDYSRAIGEFAAGHAIEPRAEFLFAWAQSLRLSGDCESAIVRYDQFVATDPPAAQARAARQLAGRCRDALAAQPEEPEEAPAPAPPPPAPPPPPQHRWWTDAWGGGLTAAGLVGVGAGVVFLARAGDADGEATSAETYAEFADAKQRAADGRSFAVWSFGAAGVLVAAGVTRYVLVARDAPTVVVGKEGDVAFVRLRGRF